MCYWFEAKLNISSCQVHLYRKMSSKNKELIQSKRFDVDVNEVVKENFSISDGSCDSGVDTGESCSIESLKTPTYSDLFSLKFDDLKEQADQQEHDCTSREEALDDICSSSLSNATSISPEATDIIENIFAPDLKEVTTSEKNVDLPNDTNFNELSKQNVPNDTHEHVDLIIQSFDSDDNIQSCNALKTDLQNTCIKNLTMSTVSLNEKPATDKVTISKSPFSKSAENLTTINQSETNECDLNSMKKDLNTEHILSEYKSHKTKVAATQKIMPDNLLPTVDSKYSRIPKELLSQDIGSIVKNVHGIFSSVSGTLKNAYTHRASAQKAIKNCAPILNGKIIDEIFEEETNEDKTMESIIEKPTSIQEKVPNTPVEIVPTKPVEAEVPEKESDPKTDILRLQIESLERVLSEQRKENMSMRERLKQQSDELQSKDQIFKDLESKMDLMSKRVEQAERDKDAAVMRYASVECTAIEARRAAESAAKAERAAIAEMELLNNKLKSAHSEKQRICQLYDDKCHELQNSEREVAKVREDLRELEGRLKWTQSKLRMEMEVCKESTEKNEKLTQQVAELEAAKEAALTNSTDAVRAKQLEAELKESQAALILCRHEKEELEKRSTAVTQQLDTCRKEMEQACGSLARTTVEVEQLKLKNLRLEEEAAELAAMRAQAALAETLSTQLARQTERASQAEEALSVERARAETCARREAAALEHAARLTAQHVAQRASTTDHEAKAQALSLDNVSLRERISELERQCERMQAQLSEETERRNKETRVLARKVAELTEELEEVNKNLEWEKGENNVLKKKHSSAIKEMNRELQRALKRCEQLETKLPPPEDNSTRAGSVSSLSSGESTSHEDRLQNGHADNLPDIQVREPDRQALIERIVSLQRAAARRSERCDFLEEHCRQLTSELRAKSRLLRCLLSELPAGAVTSRHSDNNKKEIARLGGSAMAALWGGDSTGMTLELSLEMNKRLQAVLEDTLLKNITLKENMDTLGEEISRLKQQKNCSDATK